MAEKKIFVKLDDSVVGIFCSKFKDIDELRKEIKSNFQNRLEKVDPPTLKLLWNSKPLEEDEELSKINNDRKTPIIVEAPPQQDSQKVFNLKVLESLSLADNNQIFLENLCSQGFKFDFFNTHISNPSFLDITRVNFQAFITKTQKSQDWKLISIIGASGVGKTRLSFEIAKFLKTDQNFIDIFIKMSNGDTFDNKKTTASNYITALFLYNLFNTGEIGITSILTKWTSAHISWNNDSIYELLEFYRKKKEMTKDDKLLITLRIDEVQFLIPEIYPKDVEKRRSCSIYEFSKAVMDLAFGGHKVNTFILPIFSGTLPLNDLNLFAKTSYTITPVFLSPIPPKDAKKIIRKNLSHSTSPILRDERLLDSLLYSVGPLPRALENVITIIENNPKFTLEEVYQSFIDPTIKPWDPTELEKVFFYIFSGFPFSLITLSNTIYYSLWSGVLSVVNDRLTLPIIYAQRIINPVLFQYPFLINILTFPQFPSSNQIEKFPVSFFSFKQKLFLSQNINKYPLVSFFFGALTSIDGSIMLDLGDSPIKEAESHETNITSLEHVWIKANPPQVVNCTELYSLWVGKQWTQGDAILTFPSTLIISESKLLKDSQNQIAVTGTSKNSITQEREKAFSGNLRPNYFLFCTNARSSSKRISEFLQKNHDTLVIFYDVWDNVFSSLFWFYKSYTYHTMPVAEEDQETMKEEGQETMKEEDQMIMEE